MDVDTWTRLAVGVLAGLALTAGCGGGGSQSGGGADASSGGGDAGTDQQGAPLSLSTDKLGVGFHHGEAGNIDPDYQDTELRRQIVETTSSRFDHAFLHLQSYDEHAPTFGAWTVATTPQGEKRANYFDNNPDQAELQYRAGDLKTEVEEAMGSDAFGSYGLVIDFWRMNGSWYVRWDGNFETLEDPEERKAKGAYGFFKAEMYDNLLQQIVDVAKEHEPAYIVVGTDMEKLLAGSGEQSGLAPSDFSNFKRFFRDVVREIDKAQRAGEVPSETKIGAGFNWDRFARQLAPRYGETEAGTAPEREGLKRAFENVLLPFAETGDVLALKSRRTEDGDASYYDFLAEYDEEFELPETPVLWYSIGSPVELPAYRDQRLYLQNFLKWNAGVDVEAIVWNTLINIDGSEGQGGDIRTDSRCENLIEDFQMEKSRCYDGLYEANRRPKEVMNFIEEELDSSAGGSSKDAGN